MWGSMIIKSLSGTKIYESHERTMRSALEEGAAKGIDFSYADFRGAQLRGASLDGIVAPKASFWAADLSGADVGLADLRGADLRCAILKDACLAESDLTGADFMGSYFSGTLIEGATLDNIRVSCPSFWDLDLSAPCSIDKAVYVHKGEQEIAISASRLVIDGGGERIVINDKTCLWRGNLYSIEHNKIPFALVKKAGITADKLAQIVNANALHNAKIPTQKSKKLENLI